MAEVSQISKTAMCLDRFDLKQIEKPFERHGAHVAPGLQAFARAQFQRGDKAAVHVDAANGRAKDDFDAMLCEPLLQLRPIESSKRDRWDFDLRRAAVGEEAVDENFACGADTDAIDRFIECARENEAPESVDDPRGLAMRFKPLGKWGIFIADVPLQRRQAAGDTPFLGPGQGV